MNLRPNNVLVSPHMRVVRRIGLEAEDLPVDVNSPSCHFLHANSEITASINNCNPDELVRLLKFLVNINDFLIIFKFRVA